MIGRIGAVKGSCSKKKHSFSISILYVLYSFKQNHGFDEIVEEKILLPCMYVYERVGKKCLKVDPS